MSTVPIPQTALTSSIQQQGADKTTAGALIQGVLDHVNSMPNFSVNVKAQTEVMYMVAQSWDSLNDNEKQSIISKVANQIPRITGAARPDVVFESIINLYKEFPERGSSDISKCLKATSVRPDYAPDPEERLYPNYGWLGAYIRYARESEVPVAFHFWSGVAVIGACARYKYWIDRGNDEIRLNNYVMLTAPKSVGKGVALVLAKDIINRVNRRLNPRNSSSTTQHPGTVRVLPEDSTKESIIEELQFSTHYEKNSVTGITEELTIDSCGLLGLDELANFLGRQAFSVETKVPFLTSLYNAREYGKGTRTQGRFILRNCGLSILACAAPDWLLDSITPIMFHGGFLDRWRIVNRPTNHNPRAYPTPVNTDPLLASKLAAQLITLCQQNSMVEMTPTLEANKWFEGWYLRAKRKGFDPTGKGLTLHRLANQVWKLGAVLALSESTMMKTTIEESHLIQAAKILIYEESQFASLMNFIDQDPKLALSERAEKFILDKGGLIRVTKFKDNARKWKGFTPYNKVGNQIIQDLIDSDRIQLIKAEKAYFYRLTDVAIQDLSRHRSHTELVRQAGKVIKQRTKEAKQNLQDQA